MKENEFYCHRCDKIFDSEHRAFDKDNIATVFCKDCIIITRESSKDRKKYMKSIFRTIQKEMMQKSGCTCQRCKSIFLKPEEGTKYVVELPSYEYEGKRYVKYQNDTYLSSDFLKMFEHILEFRIIDLDHLTEKEQRERNIIKEGEEFIKKKGNVSNMETEKDMREEAKITQNLCCKCHIIVTMTREQGSVRTGKVLEKRTYADQIKAKLGCEFCGFKDHTLLRYLEFDHLDPSNKVCAISKMVERDYTLEELIEEIKKCRVLCRSCHRIHTDEQKKLKHQNVA